MATYTEKLRERVNVQRRETCPECHQRLPNMLESDREMAAAIGIDHTTLWRFLNGASPGGDTIDRIEAWLAPREQLGA